MRLFYIFQLLLCIFFDLSEVQKAVIDEENELTIVWTCEIKLVPGVVIILVSYAILWLPVTAAYFERDIEGVNLFPDVFMRDIFNYPFFFKSRKKIYEKSSIVSV